MNQEQVNDTDFYNFWPQPEAPELLFFMGEDYLHFIWQSIQGLICNQNNAELLGVKSQQEPKFQTRIAQNRGNKVSYIELTWPMQILLADSSGNTRLEVEMNYKYWANLDGSESPSNNARVNVLSETRL